MNNTTFPTSIQQVLSRLAGVKSAGHHRWTANCPVNGHQTPAGHLSIEDKGDKALVTCFPTGKHKYEQICQALDFDSLTYARSPDSRPAPARRTEAIYEYKKDGRLVFEVVRTNPKGFYQRRPDDKGGYINDLNGIETFLYHHDHIADWIAGKATIYLPEGEKDVESLLERGFLATTNPGGAGKWKDIYTETLKGARVAVLQDCDEKGQAFAQQKLNALYSKTASLKLVELPGANPAVKDITDWFEAGHSPDELKDITESTPEWNPFAAYRNELICLKDVQETSLDFIWWPYLARRIVTTLEGDPGDGKSTILLAITAGITRGARLPVGEGRFPQGPVLLMSAEDGLSNVIKPRLRILGVDEDKVYAPREAFTLDENGFLTLENYIRAINPVLVGIDPIVAYLDPRVNIYQANQVRHHMARLASLAEKYNLCVVIIRHLTKSTNGKAIYRGSGSIDFTAASRSVLMTGVNEDTGERALIHTKCNIGPKGDSIGYRLSESAVLEWTGASYMTYGDLIGESGTALDNAKAWLEQALMDGEKEANVIWKEAARQHIAPATLKRAKKTIGVLCRKEEGTAYGKWYWKLKEE